MQQNKMLHFDVAKSGNINSINNGPFVGQVRVRVGVRV